MEAKVDISRSVTTVGARRLHLDIHRDVTNSKNEGLTLGEGLQQLPSVKPQISQIQPTVFPVEITTISGKVLQFNFSNTKGLSVFYKNESANFISVTEKPILTDVNGASKRLSALDVKEAILIVTEGKWICTDDGKLTFGGIKCRGGGGKQSLPKVSYSEDSIAAALRSISVLPKEEKQETISDFLNNDDVNIVVAALRSISVLPIEHQQSVLGDHLYNADANIVVAALQSISVLPIEHQCRCKYSCSCVAINFGITDRTASTYY